MIIEPYPRAVWSPWATAVVAALVVLPIGGAAVIDAEGRTLFGIATTTQFVLFPVILLAGLLVSLFFRATDCMEAAWVSAGLTTYAAPGLVLAGLRAADNQWAVREPGWVVVIHLPLALLILVVILRAERAVLRGDPMVAGLVVGLVIAAACVAAYRWAPGVAMARATLMIVIQVALFFTCIGIALAVRRLTALPRWCTDRLALGVMAVSVNHLAAAQTSTPGSSVVAAAAGVVGAVYFGDVAVALLRSALMEQRDFVRDFAGRMAVMEADDRDSQARLHEITNSIAGLAVASTLIHGDGPLSPVQRQRLEEMLESESHRLARVLGGDRLVESVRAVESHPDAPMIPALDVDEVIRPIVTSHQALRRRVHWEPSGQVARGDADAVSEVINILVDNAARHAPDAEIAVEVSRLESSLEIAVRDNGPGLPAEVRRQLGEWGGRGPTSNGKGIGLYLAHQLMASDGHSLRLDMNATGTTFVIELPLMNAE